MMWPMQNLGNIRLACEACSFVVHELQLDTNFVIFLVIIESPYLLLISFYIPI